LGKKPVRVTVEKTGPGVRLKGTLGASRRVRLLAQALQATAPVTDGVQGYLYGAKPCERK
jgi:hypothetical protein